MSKLLAKFFIKNYKEIDDPVVRNNYGKLSGIVGIITNIFLSVTKIIAGIVSFSMAIVADGLNNLSDASSSIITFIGFKMSAKPADKNHPFGHQRIEYVTGLIISFFIILVGGTLFKSGIEKIIKPEALNISPLIIILLVFSILVKVWQFYFYRTNGRLINSHTLIATSIDSLNDIITTSVVLISILISYFYEINIDGYMTLVVAIFIIISGIQLVKETISPLIGEAPPSDLTKKVTEDILGFKGVLGLHDLVIHTYGPGKTFITVHVEVDSRVDIIESHNLVDNIERYINDKYKTNLVIHMDPIAVNDEYTLKVRKLVGDVLQEIDPILCFHDFRVVEGEEYDNIIFDVEYPVDYKLSEEKLREIITTKVKKINPKYNLIIIFDVIFGDDE